MDKLTTHLKKYDRLYGTAIVLEIIGIVAIVSN
jgi:hypothetical protein